MLVDLHANAVLDHQRRQLLAIQQLQVMVAARSAGGKHFTGEAGAGDQDTPRAVLPGQRQARAAQGAPVKQQQGVQAQCQESGFSLCRLPAADDAGEALVVALLHDDALRAFRQPD